MATVISGITLYREKSTVHRFGFGGSHADDDTVFQVRSNRVSLPLRSADFSANVVIRGQNIPATLRMASIVLEQFGHNPAIFSDEEDHHVNWDEVWEHRMSSYERQFMPETWVSLHHDGQTLFTTNPSNQIEEIERVALGREIDDSTIREVSSHLIGADADVVTQHDSQTAVVFTPFKEYHRVAILERRGAGRTGSFAVSAHHPPKPKRPVRYSGFIHFCADLIEALNLKVFLERVRQMVEENRISGPPVTPAQVAGAMGRKRDLMQFIVSYERANKITYRPERPEFF